MKNKITYHYKFDNKEDLAQKYVNGKPTDDFIHISGWGGLEPEHLKNVLKEQKQFDNQPF